MHAIPTFVGLFCVTTLLTSCSPALSDRDRIVVANSGLQQNNPGGWTVTPDLNSERVFNTRNGFTDVCGQGFVDRNGMTSTPHAPRVERFILITSSASGRYISPMFDGVDDPAFAANFESSWAKLCPGYALKRGY